mmetsp:Transcript_56636/g.89764  ORF Transcript_56636/g.89764 Transcript_56636/m.89764 type:complete len:133 (+) Transcript_56636:78-476(+)
MAQHLALAAFLLFAIVVLPTEGGLKTASKSKSSSAGSPEPASSKNLIEKIMQHSRGVDYMVRYPGPSEQNWDEVQEASRYYMNDYMYKNEKDISPVFSVDQTLVAPPASRGNPKVYGINWVTNKAPSSSTGK